MKTMLHSRSVADRIVVADDATLRGSFYEIDLEAIRHNFRELRGKLDRHVKIYACLKRNGYGCGAGPVAATIATEGVDGFAVASLLDAVAIRREAASKPILLYPGAGIDAAQLVERLQLTVSVSSVDELRRWRSAVGMLHVFVKVDLGFFRAGATPASVGELLSEASADPDVCLEGIYAHMSELSPAGPSAAEAQFARMTAVVEEAQRLGLRSLQVMMSSTDGVLNYPEMDFDAVDPGALLVGISEGPARSRPMQLRHALKAIRTRLVSVKCIDHSLGPIPDGVGLRPGMVIGVIGLGWGDGLSREIHPDAVGLVRGRRARLLPPAHLEHIRIDLTGIPDARFGDEVVLLGQQGEQVITHEDVASQWGTDLVGLYAQMRDHIPRRYFQPNR